MKFKSGWAIFKETIKEFSQDRALRLSAATAYYAIFSIGPLLVLSVGLAGFVFGEDRVATEMGTQLRSFVGDKSANVIESMMRAQHYGESRLAAVLGAIALIIGATGAFGQLQDSLNTIWGVTAKPGQSIGAFIRDRLFSLAMVLGIGFLLLISMVLTTLSNAFAHYIGNLISVPAWVAPTFNDVVSFVVISLLFALIFKVLPDVRIQWRDVWVGAAGTALLFTLGKFALGRYLAYEVSASAYGAGSAFVVILMYVYYSSIILYFGAEFTQVLARARGMHFQPSKYAVRMTEFDRIEQGMPTNEQIEAAMKRAAERKRHRPQAGEMPSGAG
jgi:membrane protein